jgi:hypothetical protein
VTAFVKGGGGLLIPIILSFITPYTYMSLSLSGRSLCQPALEPAKFVISFDATSQVRGSGVDGPAPQEIILPNIGYQCLLLKLLDNTLVQSSRLQHRHYGLKLRCVNQTATARPTYSSHVLEMNVAHSHQGLGCYGVSYQKHRHPQPRN